jgi:hypothetical protein
LKTLRVGCGLGSAKKGSTAAVTRETALREGADGDQVATGLTPQPLHGAVKQMDMDRAILLQKVVVCLGKMVRMRDTVLSGLYQKNAAN